MLQNPTLWNAIALAILFGIVAVWGRKAIAGAIRNRIDAIADRINQASQSLETSRKDLEKANLNMQKTVDDCHRLRILSHEEARLWEKTIAERSLERRSARERLTEEALRRDYTMAFDKLRRDAVKALQDQLIKDLQQGEQQLAHADRAWKSSLDLLTKTNIKSVNFDRWEPGL